MGRAPRDLAFLDGHTRRPAWKAPLVLFALSFGVYACTAAYGSSLGTDLWTTHYASWQIATTGIPWLEPGQLPSWLADSHNRGFWVIEAANGHTVIGRSPGVVAAGVPFYWLFGSATFSLVPGGLTAAFLTAATLVVLFVTWKPVLGMTRSALSVLCVGFTTPVWSVAADGVWPHTVTILGISGMSWAARTERWWLVGAFGGVTLWGRLHAAVIVAVLGLGVSWYRRDPSIALKVGSVSAGFLALLCAWSHWMYGSWDPTASYDTTVFVDYASTTRLGFTNQLGMWISPGRGILVWTPLLVLLLPALWRSWRRLPDWTKALLFGGVVYTVLQAALNRYTGGTYFYGYRLTLELLACAFPAFVLASRETGRYARKFLIPLITFQFVAIVMGAVSNGRYVVLSENSWSDSGFLKAFREDPLVAGAVAALAVSLFVFFSRTPWSSSGGNPDLAARTLSLQSMAASRGRGQQTVRDDAD